jgi:hypothetical protein
MYSGVGQDQRVFRYAVRRLAEGESAWITKSHGRWNILRTKDGVREDPKGSHKSAEDALMALQDEIQSTLS